MLSFVAGVIVGFVAAVILIGFAVGGVISLATSDDFDPEAETPGPAAL